MFSFDGNLLDEDVNRMCLHVVEKDYQFRDKRMLKMKFEEVYAGLVKQSRVYVGSMKQSCVHTWV